MTAEKLTFGAVLAQLDEIQSHAGAAHRNALALYQALGGEDQEAPAGTAVETVDLDGISRKVQAAAAAARDRGDRDLYELLAGDVTIAIHERGQLIQRVADLQDAVAERAHLATWQALTVARQQVADLEADNRRLTAWAEELTNSLREAGEEEIDQAAKTSSAAYDVEAFRNTVADLEERLIAACGREGDRTAERDTAQARVTALETIGRLNIELLATEEQKRLAWAAALNADNDELKRERDTAWQRAAELWVAVVEGIAAAEAHAAVCRCGSYREVESTKADLEAAAATGRQTVAGTGPYVAVSRADLSLLIGGLDETGQWDEELSAAYLRAAAQLQPGRGTGQIVLDHEIRDVEQVATGGAT